MAQLVLTPNAKEKQTCTSWLEKENIQLTVPYS